MRRTMVALAGVALLSGGCMPELPVGSTGTPQTCMSENARFIDAWTCVRARLVARRSGRADHADGLIEEGDLLAGQVRAGKVTEAEARKRLAGGLVHDPS